MTELIAGVQMIHPKETVQVRLWKLGNLENKFYPEPSAYEKLNEILNNWDGCSNLDIVWGPDLKLEIYNVEVNGEDYVELTEE